MENVKTDFVSVLKDTPDQHATEENVLIIVIIVDFVTMENVFV
jgi:hypothetical protein